MKLIGFNTTKISAEKTSEDMTDLKIENNIQIERFDSLKSDLFKKDEEILKVDFTYHLNYSPNIAKLVFSGNILILTDSKEAKNILKQWEEKKVPEDVNLSLFNLILRKTNIRALELEDELNLPLHLKFPFLKSQKKE